MHRSRSHLQYADRLVIGPALAEMLYQVRHTAIADRFRSDAKQLAAEIGFTLFGEPGNFVQVDKF